VLVAVHVEWKANLDQYAYRACMRCLKPWEKEKEVVQAANQCECSRWFPKEASVKVQCPHLVHGGSTWSATPTQYNTLHTHGQSKTNYTPMHGNSRERKYIVLFGEQNRFSSIYFGSKKGWDQRYKPRALKYRNSNPIQVPGGKNFYTVWILKQKKFLCKIPRSL